MCKNFHGFLPLFFDDKYDAKVSRSALVDFLAQRRTEEEEEAKEEEQAVPFEAEVFLSLSSRLCFLSPDLSPHFVFLTELFTAGFYSQLSRFLLRAFSSSEPQEHHGQDHASVSLDEARAMEGKREGPPRRRQRRESHHQIKRLTHPPSFSFFFSPIPFSPIKQASR